MLRFELRLPLSQSRRINSLLLRHLGGAPVSREELAGLMPGGASERSVDVQVTRLRKKIGDAGKPRFLRTVRGAGYALYVQGAGQ